MSFWITWSVMPWGNWWHSSRILQEERSNFKSRVLLHPNSRTSILESGCKRATRATRGESIHQLLLRAALLPVHFPFQDQKNSGTAESDLTQPPVPSKHLPARNSQCPPTTLSFSTCLLVNTRASNHPPQALNDAAPPRLLPPAPQPVLRGLHTAIPCLPAGARSTCSRCPWDPAPPASPSPPPWRSWTRRGKMTSEPRDGGVRAGPVAGQRPIGGGSARSGVPGNGARSSGIDRDRAGSHRI